MSILKKHPRIVAGLAFATPALIFSLLFDLLATSSPANLGRFALVPITAAAAFIPGSLLGGALLSAEQKPPVISIILRGAATVVAAYPLMGFTATLATLLTHLGPADDALRLLGSLVFGTILITFGGFILTFWITIPMGIGTTWALIWLRKWWHS